MFGADPELLRRPRSAFDPGDQLIARRDGGGIRNVTKSLRYFQLAAIIARPFATCTAIRGRGSPGTAPVAT